MNIKELKLTEIKPYEKNPRKNNEAIKYVAESIKQFGFKVPIVLDKDNVIVCGHTRYVAAKKLKLKTVPCVMADDLTDEQIKAYRLADNKTGEFAEWDLELLNLELEELNFTDIDMSDFGFDLNLEDEEYIDESDLDEEVNKTNVTVTINCKDVNDYESIRERLQNLADEINANVAVKMS